MHHIVDSYIPRLASGCGCVGRSFICGCLYLPWAIFNSESNDDQILGWYTTAGNEACFINPVYSHSSLGLCRDYVQVRRVFWDKGSGKHVKVLFVWKTDGYSGLFPR